MLAAGILLRRTATRTGVVQQLTRGFADTKTPTFQELLTEGSSQSLNLAAKMLVELENKQKSQQAQLADLRSKIGRFSKTTEDLQKKLEVLHNNVKNQEEELTLIKKRSEKEIESAKDYALTKFAKDVIEVSDNLKKCSQLAQKKYADQPDEFLKKLSECNELLFAVLAQHDIQEFDPESMVEVPDPSKPNGTVAMVTQTGYTIKGRLLRSAKVCVYRS